MKIVNKPGHKRTNVQKSISLEDDDFEFFLNVMRRRRPNEKMYMFRRDESEPWQFCYCERLPIRLYSIAKYYRMKGFNMEIIKYHSYNMVSAENLAAERIII